MKDFDIVRFQPTDNIEQYYGELAYIYNLNNLVGKEGVVLGFEHEKEYDTNASYENALYIIVDFKDLDEVISFPKKHLTLTGKKAKQEDFYDGSSLTVSVDPETGEGTITNIDIKDDDND